MTDVKNISAIIEFDEQSFRNNVLVLIEDIKANKLTAEECYDTFRKLFLENLKVGFQGFNLEGV